MKEPNTSIESEKSDWRSFLRSWLASKIARSPQYSMRAMAKQIGINHTTLSRLLSGKRNLTRDIAEKIIKALKLKPDDANRFLVSTRTKPTYELIDLDKFALISEWEHYAVLSLLDTPNFKMSEKWIAERLRISPRKAEVVLARLQRLGLIKKNRNGRWLQAGQFIDVDNKVSTILTKKFQRQMMRKAVESLENDPPEIRDLSSITFAANPDDIAWARAQINEFRQKLSTELEKRNHRREVYNLTVQIYPVSHAKPGSI